MTPFSKPAYLFRILPSLLMAAAALLLLPASHLQAQESNVITLTGSVTDASTGETLPGVSVYLSGTTIGVATKSNGAYTLRTARKGTYDLVFSMIGYEKKVVSLELLPTSERNATRQIDAELSPASYELGKLEVRADNREWKQNYNRFEREFLGTSQYAEESSVENPWVMDFREADQAGYINASSVEPLHIVNEALGYEIFVEIDEYRWASTGTAGYYRAYPRFVEMEPENNRERRKWENNREEAFRGSRQHFFRSLYHDRINSNRFTVTSGQDLVPLSQGQVRFELMGRPGISRELMSVVKGYQLLRSIRVEHGRLNKYETSKFGGASFNITTSVIAPNRENGVFFIDALGNLIDPTSLTLQGDWANDRMADTLPMDYSPG